MASNIQAMRATRTYLELQEQSQFQPAFGDFPDVAVMRVHRATPQSYRLYYRTVGAAFRWRDRWDWSDDVIRAHLARPEIALFVATRNETLVGWYELRRVPEDGSVEIAYFGLVPTAIGQGLGKHLLSCAVRDAWTLGATRVWVHTCTLDHPHALPNYLARGFAPYRTEEYTVKFPRVKIAITKKQLILTGIVLAPILVFVLYTWSALTWSYSQGERAGYVQKFSKKGWICKTWEGELAMVSIPGTMPEKFYFTVRGDAVAARINVTLGQRVALTYAQHKGVPTSCFGETEYFVQDVRIVE